MSAAHRDKLSPVRVFHVPPDTRETTNCSALAQSELEDEQLEQVYQVRVKDRFLRCLFDSGATSSFISQTMAHRLGIPHQLSSLKSVAVADGKSVPILGTIQFPLQLGPTESGVFSESGVP